MWEVYCDAQRFGIVETNYEYASKYWAERSRVTGRTFRLVECGK